MPGFDGTGPNGKGPQGRGMGPCQSGSGEAGRGFGGRRGRGFGRGIYRGARFSENTADLHRQKKWLERQLEAIEKRLSGSK